MKAGPEGLSLGVGPPQAITDALDCGDARRVGDLTQLPPQSRKVHVEGVGVDDCARRPGGLDQLAPRYGGVGPAGPRPGGPGPGPGEGWRPPTRPPLLPRAGPPGPGR